MHLISFEYSESRRYQKIAKQFFHRSLSGLLSMSFCYQHAV